MTDNQEKVNIEVVSIDDLIQDDHNFNRGTEQGAQLIERSFRECGAGRSVFIDKDNRLVGGNKAQKGFKAAGKRKVIIVDSDADTLVAVRRKDVSLDSEEGRKMALLDNLTTQVNLAWDETELEAVQADVEGFEVADFGFDIEDLPQVVMSGEKQGEGDGKKGEQPQIDVEEDNFDEDKDDIEKRVSKGDVWQLGNHRLICGDCTDPKNYEKLMRGERADIAFTSPPYNMQATSIAKAFDSDKVKDTYGIKEGTYNEFNDALSNDDYANLLNGSLDCCLAYADEVLFNIGILAASKSGIVDMLAAHKDKFSEILVWNKDTYMPLCLPTQIHLLGHICELIFCFSNAGTRAFSHSQWKLGMKHNRIDTHGQHNNEYSKHHHATFPVEFPAAIIADFTETSIIDCFGGTGTTMIAAEQLGRKCYMLELDPHYCDIIIARWEKLTGQKAVKLNP